LSRSHTGRNSEGASSSLSAIYSHRQSYEDFLQEHPFISYSGYLTKSPPMHKVKNKIARWHLRYFILYDTDRSTSNDQRWINRKVFLCYYKNYSSAKNGESPLGVINLEKSVVSKIPPHSSVHGYPNAVILYDGFENRKYYFCSTQHTVSEAWFRKLSECVPPPSPKDREMQNEHEGAFRRRPRIERPDSGISSSEEVQHPTAAPLKSNPLPQANNIANRVCHPHPSHQNMSNWPKLRLDTVESPFKEAANFLFPTSNPSSALLNRNQYKDVTTPGLEHDTGTSTETPSDYDEMDPDWSNIDESIEGETEILQHLIIHKKVEPTESTLPLSGYDRIDIELNEDSVGLSRTNSDSSTVDAPPLPPRIKGWQCKRERKTEIGFEGPRFSLFPSVDHLDNARCDDEEEFCSRNFVPGDHNNNPTKVNTSEKNKIKFKLSVTRVHSRSLDSIHDTFLNANVSRLFNENTIEEIFPKIVQQKKDKGT
uniref:PH domain-containing protein n=1 Tax=Clytia hemisphaerica TaxID=252671 RepID=A0A7M5X443_9CNID